MNLDMTKLLATLGWRNLWRNRRRTFIMLTALVIGVWSMIWMTALMRGMVDQMVNDSIDNLSGHIQIHAPGFRDDPSISNSMQPPQGALLDELNQDDVVAWGSRLRLPAMISSERHSLPITIVGIDPDAERGLSFIMHSAIDGNMLADADDSGIVIGNKLLDKLDTRLGKRVVLMSQDVDNELADRGFRITGVYSAHVASLETQYAFTGMHTLQRLLKCKDCISEISIKSHHYLGLEPLKQRIAEASGDDEVQTWMELDPYAKAMLASANGYILIFITIIFIALSFGLANTLVMAIFERSREIALVHALGLSPRYIAMQILLEALFLIVIGMLIGNALAIASLLPIRDGIDLSIVSEGLDMFGMSTVLKPTLLGSDMLMANLIIIVLGILSCLLPAWHAARRAPAAALNRGET